MVLDVKNSPFSSEQLQLINQLIPSITDTQQVWLSGYLTGISSARSDVSNVAMVDAPAQTAVKEVTVLFGSQTGNAEALAEELTGKLANQDFEVTTISMGDFKPNTLKKLEHLLIIVSTHDEGVPPDTALPFYEFMHSRRAPKLDHLQYSVLSLGDSSYEFYCQTGKDFDKRLQELGATPFSPRVDCDLDYDEPAAEWFETVTEALNKQMDNNNTQTTSTNVAPTQPSSYSRTNPYLAEVYENINLNGRGSKKETRHLELSLEESGLIYEPGDSLGIFPKNNEQLVDAIIEKAGWDAGEKVTIHKNGDQLPLREALIQHYEITVLTKPLMQNISIFTTDANFHALLKDTEESKQQLQAYMDGRDLLDLFTDFTSWNAKADEFTSNLRKIPARLYSIASSLDANPEEVHLTVGVVKYNTANRQRHGVCSVQVAEKVEAGDKLSVYVHKNNNFRLPDDTTPIIMIGPGTGIAPYRAFMEEREARDAEGKSWLFFGDQHYMTDFLYQVEWQRWLKDGVLTKMDIAFSRDTEEKVYVQHRMQQHSREIYEWITDGAVIYVCGDEEHMAKDVHQTLLHILQNEGSMSETEAENRLKQFVQEKRYQRDVY